MMTSRHHILLALGSNSQPLAKMAEAKSLLSGIFRDINFSQEIWTKPIGIGGDDFRNCIACAYTDFGLSQVLSKLKEVETLCGRTPAQSMQNIIKMDVDLLKYDDQCYHEDDWKRPYIRQLIEEMKEINL